MIRAVGLLPALVWGVVAAFWRPRGPIFAFEALIIIAVSVAVGVVAGRVYRSRAAIFWAPVLFVVAAEITRVGFAGPTVDFPRTSYLGILALVVGRGFAALITLLPMGVGAAYGAGSTRRSRSAWRFAGRFVAGVFALVVVAIAGAVALPGRVAPITGGVSELAYAGKLGLMIRGARPDLPILLFVPDLPGGSELAAMRDRLGALERRFLVVTMDRRGGGRSFGDLDPVPTFTVDDETHNVLAAADYLRARFGRDKIYLVAHGGGTVPATLAVQEQPTDFLAYVGVAQVADPTTSDRGQYDDTLAWARSHGDTRLAGQLTRVGPPPYADLYGYEPMLLAEDRVYGSGNDAALAADARAPELSTLEKIHVLSGFLDSFDAFYPRTRDVDFKTQVPALSVPVYFVAGDREVPARVRDLGVWFSGLQAPHKQIVTLKNAGHRAMFDQPAAFADLMARVVAGP
jgi:pimeloyl-ACP methyl ester carboxylesterase